MFEEARIRFKVPYPNPFEQKLKKLGWTEKDGRFRKNFGGTKVELQEKALPFSSQTYYSLYLMHDDAGLTRHQIFVVMEELEDAKEAAQGRIKLKNEI